jgi:hypothetical protein
VAEQRRAVTGSGVSGALVGAFVVALVAVLVAVGALVWAHREQSDAQRDQARVRHELVVSARAGSSDRLSATQQAIASVQTQLDALPAGLHELVDLQNQEATLVQAALDAGKAGNVPAYNEAVTKRNVLAPQIDAAVEKLRTDVNAVLIALATVTNRTAP